MMKATVPEKETTDSAAVIMQYLSPPALRTLLGVLPADWVVRGRGLARYALLLLRAPPMGAPESISERVLLCCRLPEE